MLIDDADYLVAAEDALEAMAAILLELGDDLANSRPDLPGANTPYQIVTHCLGVLDFWVGRLVAGRDVARDRDAEFRARGHVTELVARLGTAAGRLREDVATAAGGDAPFRLPADRPGMAWPTTQGGALLHAHEELAQHRGQLELTRDVLRSAAGRDAGRGA